MPKAIQDFETKCNPVQNLTFANPSPMVFKLTGKSVPLNLPTNFGDGNLIDIILDIGGPFLQYHGKEIKNKVYPVYYRAKTQQEYLGHQITDRSRMREAIVRGAKRAGTKACFDEIKLAVIKSFKLANDRLAVLEVEISGISVSR